MEDIIDIIVTETTNTIEITSQSTDEVIDVNIIDNREDITLNVTPTLVEININSLTGNFGVNWGDITGTLSNQTDLNTALGLKADLVGGKVPSSQLPSYVDDVVEVANYAALPATGETGKIYVTIDTNYIYRWTGSVYVEIKDSSAVWGAITGTLSNQTDLQNALNAKLNVTTAASTYVPYTGATADVDLGAYKLAAQDISYNGSAGGGFFRLKTQSQAAIPQLNNVKLSAGQTSDLVISSDSYNSTLVTSSNTADRTYTFPNASGTIALTSDLHNAVTIGTANGLSLSTQVLSLGLASSSANGALSSTDWTTFNSKQAALSGTGFVKISGTTISYDNTAYISGSGTAGRYARFTSSGVIYDGFIQTTSNITYVEGMGLSTYNGLDIQGNYGAGGGGLKIRSYDETTGNAYIDFANTGGRMYLGLNRSTASGLMTNATAYATVLTTGLGTSNLEFGTNATKRLTIDGTTGAVTLTSALSGTSATFSGNVTVNGSSIDINPASGQPNITLRTANTFRGYIEGNSAGGMSFGTGAGAAICLTLASSGAATFSSSVDTNSYIRNTNSGANAAVTIATDGTSHYIQATNAARTVYNNLLLNPYGGNVGIGTTSPANYTNYITQTINGTNGAIVQLQSSGTPSLRLIGEGVDSYLDNVSTGALIFRTTSSSSERMRITSSGNVGIGTTSPGTKLHLISALGTDAFAIGETGSNQRFRIGQESGYTGNYINSTNIDLKLMTYTDGGSGGNIVFYTSSNTSLNERMAITRAGNVGIGTSSPSGRLHILNASGTGQPALELQQSNSGSNILQWKGSSGSYLGIISDAGNVGIGTTSPAEKLDVNGYVKSSGSSSGFMYPDRQTGVNYILYGNDSGYSYFYNSSVGNVGRITMSNGVYTALSDVNKKKDFEDSNIGLYEVMQLKPTMYRMKTDSSDVSKQLGFIAQEVKDYIPQAYEESGDFIGLNFNPIVAALTKAIQELKAELDTLKNK